MDDTLNYRYVQTRRHRQWVKNQARVLLYIFV